jgi:hypothetical protein
VPPRGEVHLLSANGVPANFLQKKLQKLAGLSVGEKLLAIREHIRVRHQKQQVREEGGARLVLTWRSQMRQGAASGINVVLNFHNGAKTHCKRGHPFDEANTGWRADGVGRYCRACQKMARQRHAQKKARDLICTRRHSNSQPSKP